MTPFNPDSWQDVIVLVFLGACSVVTAGIPVWSKLKKIDHQVSNTHDTNLRDDLDKLAEAIEAGFAESRTEFRLIHESLNLERRERIAGDQQKEA